MRGIVDDGDLLEVHEHWARNIVVGFARMGGFTVGLVGNSPDTLAGVLDIDASAQGGALRALLRLLQYPAGDADRTCRATCRARCRSTAASSRTGAKLIYAYAEATVPKIAVHAAQGPTAGPTS